ncbi:MAG: class I SAM-dependent methyltransferase [Chloroflexi bacterium]|nr:class I SAM-dependent methyltransferase [Chloroflexota bacterium]
MHPQDWRDPELAQRWSAAAGNNNPMRNQHLDLLLLLLEQVFEPGKTILDLGYGSGLVDEAIFQRIETAQIVGVDRSEAMMALAAERLAAYPFKFISVTHDMTDLPALLGPDSPLPRQQYQIAINVQALHHLPHESLRAGYHAVYEILEPGGYFFQAERIAVPSAAVFDLYHALWAHLDGQYGTQVAASEQSSYADHVAHLARREDHPAALQAHLAWLAEAGFDAACLDAYGNRALIAARKP